MGLFGKKKQWDTQKSDANKSRLRELFNGVMEDGDSYDIVLIKIPFYPKFLKLKFLEKTILKRQKLQQVCTRFIIKVD